MVVKKEKPISDQTKALDFIAQNFGTLKFLSLAALIFGALFIIYSMFLVESALFGRYLELYASLTSQFVNSVFGEESFVMDTVLRLKVEIRVEDNAYVQVTKGYDASLVIAILVASVLAWPSQLWKRIVVAGIGVAFIFGMNVLRIAGMLLTDIYLPMYYDLIADWVLPLILVLVASAYFYCWAAISGRHPADSPVGTD